MMAIDLERRRLRWCRTKQKYRETHPERFRAQQRRYDRTRNEKYREAIFVLLGRCCARCGFSDRRALQVDHRTGGGLAERRASGHDVVSRCKRILADPSKYQMLCANCNWIKRHENKEFGARKRVKDS